MLADAALTERVKQAKNDELTDDFSSGFVWPAYPTAMRDAL